MAGSNVNLVFTNRIRSIFTVLWSALVISGCCVSAHEMAATWAMNSLGAPALWLSLMSSAGTFPFLLFTVPAGALADLSPEANARFQLLAGLQRRLTALLSFLHRLTPEIILTNAVRAQPGTPPYLLQYGYDHRVRAKGA